MSQPNLNEIKEISILLDKIEQYKKIIAQSNKQLKDTEIYYKNLEQTEKQKISEDLKQKNSLLQLEEDIHTFRLAEQDQKIEIYLDIENKFNTFMDSDSMKQIIRDGINALQDEIIEIICDPKYKILLPDNSKVQNGSQGQLRLSSKTKEYILDPEYLKKLIFDKFLVSSSDLKN
jgi:hypothetical protein